MKDIEKFTRYNETKEVVASSDTTPIAAQDPDKTLQQDMRTMVQYIMPDECFNDKDLIDSYTETMVTIAKDYHSNKLKFLKKE